MNKRRRKMKFILISVVVILGLGGLLFLVRGNGTQTAEPSLSIQTIQADVAQGGRLIDVRTSDEYTSGHIDGAVNLSLQDIQAGAVPAFTAKDKPVYVYCRSGNRSSQAAAKLKAVGYRNIIDLGAMTHVQLLGGIIKP